MRSKRFVYFVLFLFILACNKDEGVISVHSGLTRVEYSITDPFEMPRIEFKFNNTYNLVQHTNFSIDILTAAESERLNLMIMLEDIDGNRTDELPMEILEEDLILDDNSVSYSFNILEHLASSTGGNNEIQLDKIKKVQIYINAGIGGKLSEGKFWLDKLEFTKP